MVNQYFIAPDNIDKLISVCETFDNACQNYVDNRNNPDFECTHENFKLYLESKFEPWMTWDNYGLYNGTPEYGWDIDHIIPSSTAKDEFEIISLNHYTNLQPLCSYYNRVIKTNNPI
jgi:hypothetical protein